MVSTISVLGSPTPVWKAVKQVEHRRVWVKQGCHALGRTDLERVLPTIPDGVRQIGFGVPLCRLQPPQRSGIWFKPDERGAVLQHGGVGWSAIDRVRADINDMDRNRAPDKPCEGHGCEEWGRVGRRHGHFDASKRLKRQSYPQCLDKK